MVQDSQQYIADLKHNIRAWEKMRNEAKRDIRGLQDDILDAEKNITKLKSRLLRIYEQRKSTG